MQKLTDGLRSMGADAFTINVFIVVFTSTIALLIVGFTGAAIWLMVNNEVAPPWLIGVISSVVSAIVLLITISAQTSHINSTTDKATSNAMAAMAPVPPVPGEDVLHTITSLASAIEDIHKTVVAQSSTQPVPATTIYGKLPLPDVQTKNMPAIRDVGTTTEEVTQ